jgi:hypothetical protein
VLEIELVVDNEPEILYANVYKGDKTTILVWFEKLGLGH